MSLCLLDQRDLRDIPPPPFDFVLPGLLAGAVGSLVAPGATGKSMFALQAAAYLAGGPDSLGLGPIVRGPVLYLSLEDDEAVLAHRLHTLHSSMCRRDSEQVCQRLQVAALAATAFDLDENSWLEQAISAAIGARLVIVDTLRQAHSKDENCGTEMRHVLHLLRQLAGPGRAVLFLHHVTKAAALGGAGDVQQASRGSSVLTDNIRFQMNMTALGREEAEKLGVEDVNRKEYVRLSFSKVNACKPLPDRWYRRGVGGLLSPVEFAPGNKPQAARKPPAPAEAEASNELW